MVFVRSTLATLNGYLLSMALTISVRYSAVRWQEEINPGLIARHLTTVIRTGEVKIIEYQTQQYRLFPNIARAYAMVFAGEQTRNIYFEGLDEINHSRVGNKRNAESPDGSPRRSSRSHIWSEGFDLVRGDVRYRPVSPGLWRSRLLVRLSPL